MIKEKRNLVKLLLVLPALVFFLVGFSTLPDYGINWDEAIHFIRGQTYWRYFTTGKKDYRDLPVFKIHLPKNDRVKTPQSFDFEDDRQFRRSLYQNDAWTLETWLRRDGGHPPASDILAAVSNGIFYQKLGILEDVEAHHLFIIFVSTISILAVGLFAAETYGPFAGLVAGISLALYPLFLGESHFNIKDPPETCFFALTIWFFWKAIKCQSAKWTVVSAVFCGLAMGTKFNILFLPLIILPWLIARGIKRSLSKKMIGSLLLFPAIVFAVFFILWPYLWQNPANIFKIFHYYETLGLRQIFQPLNFFIGGFNAYPFLAILFTTPLVTLFFAAIGIVAGLCSLKKDKDKIFLLWLLWFLIPIIRVSVPGTSIYGGTRQIMEFVPAMALLAGFGADRAVRLFRHQFAKILIIFMFFPLAFKLFSLHPNEGLYFNPLIGGLKGAAQRNFPNWGLSLGNEYRQGIKWLNQNAEKEADLTLGRGLLSDVPRIWLRSDINFGDYYFSGDQKRGEYIMELTYEGWERWVPEKAKYLKTIQPVYQLEVEGVPVLKIWKNSMLK